MPGTLLCPFWRALFYSPSCASRVQQTVQNLCVTTHNMFCFVSCFKHLVVPPLSCPVAPSSTGYASNVIIIKQCTVLLHPLPQGAQVMPTFAKEPAISLAVLFQHAAFSFPPHVLCYALLHVPQVHSSQPQKTCVVKMKSLCFLSLASCCALLHALQGCSRQLSHACSTPRGVQPHPAATACR